MSESDSDGRVARKCATDLYHHCIGGSWPQRWSRTARQVMGASTGDRCAHGPWATQTQRVPLTGERET
jgi:hypothetical protein